MGDGCTAATVAEVRPHRATGVLLEADEVVADMDTAGAEPAAPALVVGANRFVSAAGF